ncbi:MAG: hypothetical protein ACFFCQ_16410 [Promethearchaeota archaeon]
MKGRIYPFPIFLVLFQGIILLGIIFPSFPTVAGIQSQTVTVREHDFRSLVIDSKYSNANLSLEVEVITGSDISVLLVDETNFWIYFQFGNYETITVRNNIFKDIVHTVLTKSGIYYAILDNEDSSLSCTIQYTVNLEYLDTPIDTIVIWIIVTTLLIGIILGSVYFYFKRIKREKNTIKISFADHSTPHHPVQLVLCPFCECQIVSSSHFCIFCGSQINTSKN